MTKLAQNLFAFALAVLIAGTSLAAVVTVPVDGDKAGAMIATRDLA